MRLLLITLAIITALAQYTETDPRGVYWPNVAEVDCGTDECLEGLVRPQSAIDEIGWMETKEAGL